jgi:oxygen-independent coproporphyrinogen-3 oxidase
LQDLDRACPAFGVYVHWPFCLSKCPYCDFNSHVRHDGVDEARFARAFAAEIAATAARAPGRTVSTIFFGGGTPSLMQPATVGAILDAVARHWPIARDVEVTLEANPTSVEATRFRGFRAAGVNRVSLGVQALDDAALKALGRLHSAQEALEAVTIARSTFERYSFDLIYARPGQTPRAWAAELKRATEEAGEHLSLYQLTIEQETPFATLQRQLLIGLDTARALYDATRTFARRRPLRSFQPRAAGRRVPAQPRLLACAACRDRPRRAWPARHRGRAARHHQKKRPRDESGPGGTAPGWDRQRRRR